MTVFQKKKKLLTRTYCDEAGYFAVPNVLSPRDLVLRPDYRTKTGPSSVWEIYVKVENKI